MFCPDCGHRHYFYTGKSVSLNKERYVCSGFQSRRVECDNAHYIREMVLEKIVLNSLNEMIALVNDFEKEVITTLENKEADNLSQELKTKERKLVQSERRVSELDSLIKRLYEDNINGKLSVERYIQFSKDYEKEQKDLKVFVLNTKESLSKQQEEKLNIQKFIKTVKKYTALYKLTPTILNRLIQRIEVHKPDKCSGKRVQQVDIYYQFVGMLSDMDFNKEKS